MIRQGMLLMTDKTYDAGAERAVIGSILLDNSTLDEAATLIDAQSFYVKAHRLIWAAALDLQRRGQAVDVVTLGSHLKDKGRIEDVGGAIGLTKFSDSATSTNVMGYATIIRDKAATRNMISTARVIVEQGTNGVVDVQEYLLEARTEITKAASLGAGKEPTQLGEGVADHFDELFSGESPRGLVETGFRDLDYATGGLWPGLLTVVACRPSMGKSAFVLNMAVNIGLAGKKALYCTMEDATWYQQQRALSRLSDVDFGRITRNRVRGAESSSVMNAARTMSSIPVWIHDQRMSAKQLAQIATRHSNTHGLDVLIVDHLGYFNSEGDEYKVTSSDVRTCANLAAELGIPVVLAAQLNRKLEERALSNRRPTNADLRGSGKIEEDARIVWFLYRDFVYNPTTADPHEMEVIVSKATHGQLGTIKLHADLAKMYIRNKGVENGY